MQVLLSGTDFPHAAGEFSPRKTMPYYGVYCFRTPFLYQSGSRLVRGEPGDLLINPPGSIVCHGPTGPEESFTNDWMHISADFSALLERYPLPCDIAIPMGDPTLLTAAIEQIRAEQLLDAPGSKEMVDCTLTQLVISLHRRYLRGQAQTAQARLDATRSEILRSPEKPWTLAEMAQHSGYSPSRFSALYTRQFGLSPKAELLQARLSMAKQLLRYSDLSVSSVASLCGFQSVYYFSKYFREHTGMSPSTYAHAHSLQV